jgi:hypothetical protein
MPAAEPGLRLGQGEECTNSTYLALFFQNNLTTNYFIIIFYYGLLNKK